jgi:hypothetical protein
MTFMSSSECRRDGFGVGVELFLELTHVGIRWFTNDDGEVQMREGETGGGFSLRW